MKKSNFTIVIVSVLIMSSGIIFSQTQPVSVFSSGTGTSENTQYKNFGTLGQPFSSVVSNSTYTNKEGFLNAQFQLAEKVYVSSTYDQSSQIWGFDHFNNLDDALLYSTPDAEVNISNYSYTGNVDVGNREYIIGSGDFTLNGNLTGGLITAVSGGRLSMPVAQNTQRTFPVTDGTNNFQVKITPLEAGAGNLSVKLNAGKSVDGALKSPMAFWDLYGPTNLNATVVLRLDKSVIAPAVIPANFLMRYYNGSRYVAIPTERVSVVDNLDYYEITITGMNNF